MKCPWITTLAVLVVPVAFVAVVSVAFVVLVRKEAHDHAICTVVVVPHPVMTDYHHRHSLELVSVEVPVFEIVVVIAHAIHFMALALSLTPSSGGLLLLVCSNLQGARSH